MKTQVSPESCWRLCLSNSFNSRIGVNPEQSLTSLVGVRRALGLVFPYTQVILDWMNM